MHAKSAAINSSIWMTHIFKAVRLIPHSYEMAPGRWRAHIVMQLEDYSKDSIEAVAALRLFDSEVEANAIALSWARTLVARDTWCNGKHMSSSMDTQELPQQFPKVDKN